MSATYITNNYVVSTLRNKDTHRFHRGPLYSDSAYRKIIEREVNDDGGEEGVMTKADSLEDMSSALS